MKTYVGLIRLDNADEDDDGSEFVKAVIVKAANSSVAETIIRGYAQTHKSHLLACHDGDLCYEGVMLVGIDVPA